MENEIGNVLESTAGIVVVKMEYDKFEKNKDHLKVGKYLKIDVGNNDYIIATIKNMKAIFDVNNEGKEKYILTTEPIGCVCDQQFIPGSSILPSPTEKVYVASSDVLRLVFLKNEKYSFKLGKLIQDKEIDLYIDGNNFFSKHIAVVGSTGSGKSCTVAKILQEATGISEGNNINKEKQKNAHIIIFDIHSEYKAAFTMEDSQKFSVNYLDVEKLKLPYWLMNSEELESLFIESNESNSHNQISQFRKAVLLNKKKYNKGLEKITYDTPVYFNLQEVFNYIWNLNNEVINKIAGEEQLPRIIDNQDTRLIKDEEEYFLQRYTFVPNSTATATKASNGAFSGEFDRFIVRLDNKINDKRFSFLIASEKEDGSKYMTEDFNEILKQFLGYLNKANVSIIDLSGVPFEVLSITVSLISRLVFDFAFHYSKLQHDIGKLNDVPFLIVCEEAHNYIPKNGGADYSASKKSLERIAKEGRKYGLSLMVVSQRPSEVSDTIFAQCNNFISLRLTNMTDQSYIKNLLPNNSNAIADILPILAPGECLVVGDATPIPTVVKMDMPNPQPESKNVKVHNEWKMDWKHIEGKQKLEVTIEDVVRRWKKQV